MRKTLHLEREVLTELTHGELTGVAGGSHNCLTSPLTRCLSFRVCEASHYLACQVPSVADPSCAC